MIEEKMRKVELLVVNCEGVITDSSLMIMENGEELRRFSAKDIFGFKLIAGQAGVDIALVSSEEVNAFNLLAAKLNLSRNYLGFDNKEGLIDKICEDYKISPEQMAYIGCELDDLYLMRAAGFSMCPLDAAYEVINAADYVCNSCGGNGVIREVADFIRGRKVSVSAG